MAQLPLFNDASATPKKAVAQPSTPAAPTPPTITQPQRLPAGTSWHLHTVQGQELGYLLKRSRRQSIGLRVNEHGLIITAPTWVSMAQVHDALEQKFAWIVRKLLEWEERLQQLALGKSQWCDNGSIPYLGVAITLKLDPEAFTTHFSGNHFQPNAGDILTLPLAKDAQSSRVQDLAQIWLQDQARHYCINRLNYYTAKLGLPYSGLRLANPAKRWGSCSSDGMIMLNWRLIHFPVAAVDYVIAHEVAHLKEMNHSPAFWREVEKLMPDYVTARNLLKKHHPDTLPLL